MTIGLAIPDERLAWKAALMPATGTVLLQVDGGAVQWMPQAGTFEDVLPYRPNPSFLGVSGSSAVVLDLADGADLQGVGRMQVPPAGQRAMAWR